MFCLVRRDTETHSLKVISLSDIFISPLEDMLDARPMFFIPLLTISEIFRNRTPRNRPTSPPHITTTREAVHPVLPLPDPCMSTFRRSGLYVITTFSAASSTSIPQELSTATSSPAISWSTRTATLKSVTLDLHEFKTHR